ncbi:hypothetical protein HOP50_09g55520 [Chloropicon primus]|uniref:Uncharacterized protein n=1 Tax=Chloropicon primus TaxID=1764295 RepID=A0A5B8MR20_9CHLO|nr:hypothetical protein A3770_09p55270 [Chloropicon primus]UPR02226.1 hypothetical protein HOP50_09g55520 [Chloropicon primus]|eukprot:QDZ23009.1 hypothetical protein A3770_09p55270 [Chloropicon primus]
MGKKRPLFRSRQLPLTNLNNVKEPMQSLSVPISRVVRTKGGRPRRVNPPSEEANGGRPVSLPERVEEEGEGLGRDRGGSARATAEVAGSRRGRAGGGHRKRPTRHQSERVVKSAESGLVVAEKENAFAGGEEARYQPFFQLPSHSRAFEAAPARAAPKKPFIGAKTFEGPKEGYVYGNGKFGVGYYVDQLPKVQGEMCANAMVNFILDECMVSVKRLSIIKARRVVNALVDSTVEISHHQSEIHWYENMREERSEMLRENLDFAACHDRSRWESWDVLVREMIRLRSPESVESSDYLSDPAFKGKFAESHSKRPEDISAVLELLEDSTKTKGKLSMEHSAKVLAKYRISPRALKGLHMALNRALAREVSKSDKKSAPTICRACTSLRGRRLCSQCMREKKGGEGGARDRSSRACVRQNSYGSLLYKGWLWWESKEQLGRGAIHTNDKNDLHDSLLDMVYRLQSKALRRIFNSWKLHVFQTKATRAKVRLTSAKVVASAFHRWKKLLDLRKQKQDRRDRASSSASSSPSSEQKGSSSYVSSYKASSSMKAVGEKIKKVN